MKNESNKSKVLSKLPEIVLIFFFILIFGAPITLNILQLSPGQDPGLTDQRLPDQLPELNLSEPVSFYSFPEKFNVYSEKTFPFRADFNRLFSLIKTNFAGVTIRQTVLVGDSGWFYITYNNAIEDYRGAITLTEKELENIRETLEERRDWLAAFGIKYLLLSAPSKWEIYPENIPIQFRRQKKNSRMDQVYKYLKETSDMEILDIRADLGLAKLNGDVFLKTDTHWNDMGAFIAAQKISHRLKTWFAEIELITPDKFQFSSRRFGDGNLVSMMGLEGVIAEEVPAISRKEEFGPRKSETEADIFLWHKRYRSVGEGIRALIFTDSYGPWLERLLCYAFRSSLFIWKEQVDPFQILKEKPDVLVHEAGQVSFVARNQSNPMGIAGYSTNFRGTYFYIYLPETIQKLDLRIRAVEEKGRTQRVVVSIDGQRVKRRKISSEFNNIEIPVPSKKTRKGFKLLEIKYQHPGRVNSRYDGKVLPFTLNIETGGEDPNFYMTGISGVYQEGGKGYNLYHINKKGSVVSSESFNTSMSATESDRLARVLKFKNGEEGYLLLVSRYMAGRKLQGDVLSSMADLGISSYLQTQPRWSHIVLVDLQTKKTIFEKISPGRLGWRLGNFKPLAGFELEGISKGLK